MGDPPVKLTFVEVLLLYLKYTNIDDQRRVRNCRHFLVIDGYVSCVMHCNRSGADFGEFAESY